VDFETKHLELGKKSNYETQYAPGKLFGFSRDAKRLELGMNPNRIPFYGFDLWNHYEVSWLNLKGKPLVAVAEILYDCTSPNIIESKSLKLYFNSLNNTRFESAKEVADTVQKDLSLCIEAPVEVHLRVLNGTCGFEVQESFEGESLDELDVECSVYCVEPSFLKAGTEIVEETLCSNLLKSNCLVTYQPDWGSVQIHYQGPKIDREGLLQYLVSFRNHNEFHEQCIERIFMDLMQRCKPSELTVFGRYTRRGGLDINPLRSTQKQLMPFQNKRLIRQ
jgi:7-cyano-7-deazaguanine reductase